MAKTSAVEKNKRRRKTVASQAGKRAALPPRVVSRLQDRSDVFRSVSDEQFARVFEQLRVGRATGPCVVEQYEWSVPRHAIRLSASSPAVEGA